MRDDGTEKHDDLFPIMQDGYGRRLATDLKRVLRTHCPFGRHNTPPVNIS